jgi:hypothetical protein
MKKREPGDSLTYDEWTELGFYVRKGEKSLSRNNEGKAVFSPRQVEEKEEDPTGLGWDGWEDD